MKIELTGREAMSLVFGFPMLMTGLVLISILVGARAPTIQIDAHTNSAPRVEAVLPEGSIKVDAKVTVPAAQVTIQQVPVDRVQVPDVKIQNVVQPAKIEIQVPTKPILVHVVNLQGLGTPEKKSEDPFGDTLLPEPKK